MAASRAIGQHFDNPYGLFNWLNNSFVIDRLTRNPSGYSVLELVPA